MSWTQEEEEAYIFEQSIKKKSVKQLEQEIIYLIYIYVDELNNNAIQLTSVWC